MGKTRERKCVLAGQAALAQLPSTLGDGGVPPPAHLIN